MRFLIVGAGALGGYFGGRLLQHGQDVTFLVRQRRAAELRTEGLVIKSPHGDVTIADPPQRLADQIDGPYDVIVVGCKAYDLNETMESFAPAVGTGTAILPLLNGLRHLELLQARFGAQHVLGGQCQISATLDQRHVILHLTEMHTLGFGEVNGENSARVQSIAAACDGAGFDAKPSTEILQEMWEKWVFIAAAAGITCLLRASIGDIVEAQAADLALALYDECAEIAAHAGFGPRLVARERGRSMLSAPGSPITASMLKDIERGSLIEADHVVGDMLSRGQGILAERSLLRVAFGHLKAYEARRQRELAQARSQ